MTTSNFNKKLLIEQLRLIEESQVLICNEDELSPDNKNHQSFEDRLWQRAQCLIEQQNLSPLLVRAQRLSYYARIIVLIVAALFGVIGVLYAVSDRSTINIYWLLLVLLGFNLASIVLWLVGISLNIKSLVAGALARLTSWLPKHIKNKNHSVGNAADKAWLICNYSGTVGKWQFSKTTHQLWLVYLIAGFAFLVLLLMVRQYDFIWGTTLLPDSAFLKLTDILSTPLEAIGFSTPTVDQINDTRIGTGQILTAEHRYHWAQFLLAALLFYGIAPRLVLFGWSTVMCNHARRRFTLDYYLPYYIRLRQQLIPLASHGEIIDADSSPPTLTVSPTLKPSHQDLPDETFWVAVELGANLNWSPESVVNDKNLGEITDRDTLYRVMDYLQHTSPSVLAIAVAAARPPDRGVQRIIKTLVTTSDQNWLVLLQSGQVEKIPENRLTAWYRLAEACEIPADHVISMRIS